MNPSWWEIALGVTSVVATVTIPWAAAAGAGQKRRGEQAQISFILARELRSMREAEDARQYSPMKTEDTLALIERMGAAAKFMAAEYSNSVLRTTRAAQVMISLAYGFLFVIYGLFMIDQSTAHNAVPLWAGYATLGFGIASTATGVVLWIRVANKRSRLKSAGVRSLLMEDGSKWLLALPPRLEQTPSPPQGALHAEVGSKLNQRSDQSDERIAFSSSHAAQRCESALQFPVCVGVIVRFV